MSDSNPQTATRTADEQQIIDLEIGGSDPVGQVKNILAGYDVSDSDISRISISIFEQPQPQPEPAQPQTAEADGGTTADSGTSKTWKRLTEDDRELKNITENTAQHVVLAALDAADVDECSAKDIADLLHDDIGKDHASSVLSKLYRRQLADREDGKRPYTYWINAHGQAELDRIGRDVERDQVDGAWGR